MLTLSLSTSAHAAEKIALVIANQHYQQSGASLQRPLADAQSMIEVLKQNQFQIYGGRVQSNLNRQQFEHTVKQFARQARGAKVAVVYYAGHGTQDGKANYLIPVDAKIEKAVDYRYQAVELRFVLDYLNDAGAPVNLVFLDACRDNPFGTDRGGTRGLLRVATPPEILVSYATSQGSTAQDQSPYTPALVRSMRQLGNKTIYELMTKVAADVVQQTGGRQRPDFSSSLTRNFCFAGCGGAGSQAVTASVATPPALSRPDNNTHHHGNRTHSHPLPATGLNHQHGNGVSAAANQTPQAVAEPAPLQPAQTATPASSKRFTVNGDGTVSDSQMGLMWKQCSEGLSGAGCQSGGAKTYTWQQAMDLKGSQFAGYNDWRLPTIDELHSLVYCSNGTPSQEARDSGCIGEDNRNGDNYQRPTISRNDFPNTKSRWYWSSSPYANFSGAAWGVHFSDGGGNPGDKHGDGDVRLVRGGQ